MCDLPPDFWWYTALILFCCCCWLLAWPQKPHWTGWTPTNDEKRIVASHSLDGFNNTVELSDVTKRAKSGVVPLLLPTHTKETRRRRRRWQQAMQRQRARSKCDKPAIHRGRARTPHRHRGTRKRAEAKEAREQQQCDDGAFVLSARTQAQRLSRSLANRTEQKQHSTALTGTAEADTESKSTKK